MGKLHAIHLRAAPLHTTISGTLKECDPTGGWKSHQITHGQSNGTIDHTVDHQTMLIGIYVRYTRVIALKHEPARGNNTLEICQGSKTDGGHPIRGQPVNGSSLYIRLEG
jgi:hypothetical protein